MLMLMLKVCTHIISYFIIDSNAIPILSTKNETVFFPIHRTRQMTNRKRQDQLRSTCVAKNIEPITRGAHQASNKQARN